MSTPRFVEPFRLAKALASLALVAAPALGQKVWVVDDTPGPGVNFSDIQPAIDASTDGDVILLKSGAYSGFTIAGKSVVLEADQGAQIDFLGGFSYVFGRVVGTSKYQPVVLRGIKPNSGHLILGVVNAAGPVFAEDCRLGPEYPIPFPPPEFALGLPGVFAQNSDSLILRRCDVRGSKSFGTTLAGGSALAASQSTVSVFDSTFIGGVGAKGCTFCGSPVPGQAGGDGARVTGGSLYASDCMLIGGDGGDGGTPGGGSGGQGGNGVEGLGGAVVRTYNGSSSGGSGGSALTGYPHGADGVPFLVNGVFVQRFGPKRTSVVSSPVRVGQSFNFGITTQTPSIAFVFLSTNPGQPVDFAATIGSLLLDLSDLGMVAFGGVDAGTTNLSILAPPIFPGTLGSTITVQSVFTDSTFSFLHITAPTHLTVLEGSL